MHGMHIREARVMIRAIHITSIITPILSSIHFRKCKLMKMANSAGSTVIASNAVELINESGKSLLLTPHGLTLSFG